MLECLWRNCFGGNFLGGFFGEKIFGRIFFWEDFFWEEFFWRNFLGGIFWEEFFVYIVKVIWIWKGLICLSRFWFLSSLIALKKLIQKEYSFKNYFTLLYTCCLSNPARKSTILYLASLLLGCFNSSLFYLHMSTSQGCRKQGGQGPGGHRHFLTLKGLWQINAQLWIWPWRSENSDFESQYSTSKILRILPIFFPVENIKSGAKFILMTLFVHWHFWSTLFTIIGPKFPILIPNRALICQRPFKVRKCLLPFN